MPVQAHGRPLAKWMSTLLNCSASLLTLLASTAPDGVKILTLWMALSAAPLLWRWSWPVVGCAHEMFACPLFGERFSGPNYPLTKAVALAGIGVQPPLDILIDDDPWDFSTTEGKQRWDEYEVEPGLLSEHFAPECKTFSAARGRPALTTSGRWIAGPRALRSDLKPWGLDHLSPQEQVKVRRGNTMAKRSLRGLKAAFDNDRFGVLEHPYSSHLWSTPEAIELAERSDVYHTYFSARCYGGARTKWTSLLHNIQELHDQLHKPTCPGHENLLPYEVLHEERAACVSIPRLRLSTHGACALLMPTH